MRFQDEKAPKWAEGLFDLLKQQQQHIAVLEEQQQQLVRHSSSSRTDGTEDDEGEDGTVRGIEQAPTVDQGGDYDDEYDDEVGLRTPHMTIPIETPRDEDEELYDDDDEDQDGRTETRSKMGTATQRDYEDELGELNVMPCIGFQLR